MNAGAETTVMLANHVHPHGHIPNMLKRRRVRPKIHILQSLSCQDFN